MQLTDRIRDRATSLGFDLVGVAPAREARTAAAYRQWVQRGYHGKMAWLGRTERRSDPQKVLPTARFVVTLGVSYCVENPPAALWNDPSRGRVARYAWGPDYHDVLTPRLRTLSDFIRQEAGPNSRTRYYVDTGPVLERAFAADAGLGFIGKNTMLISPGYGSYVFLAEILTDVELEPDPGSPDPSLLTFTDGKGQARTGSCGSCTRCLEACPTRAFAAPYVLDSRRCLSYLTIELKDEIPVDLRPLLGNWIFGCDMCQSVCPWVRRYAKPAPESFLAFKADLAVPSLPELMSLDDAGFRRRFQGTPVQRTKRRGLLRNAAVALGNWGDPAAIPVLEKAREDREPLIRDHASWALDRIRERG